MKNIIIIGATSAMAQEAARCFAKDGDNLYLIGRNPEKMSDLVADLRGRSTGNVTGVQTDLMDTDKHEELINAAYNELNTVDAVLLAHGTLGDQQECEQNYKAAQRELISNFASNVSLITPIANKMEEAGAGTIAVITSVAGDRGRKGNYIYGCAKGATSLFLQGLRNRLADKGVAVVDIRPGFVDTPMTADMPKGPLFASAKSVGAGIYKAMNKKKDIVYLPFFWRYIMLIIKMIPEGIFKKLSI